MKRPTLTHMLYVCYTYATLPHDSARAQCSLLPLSIASLLTPMLTDADCYYGLPIPPQGCVGVCPGGCPQRERPPQSRPRVCKEGRCQG